MLLRNEVWLGMGVAWNGVCLRCGLSRTLDLSLSYLVVMVRELEIHSSSVNVCFLSQDVTMVTNTYHIEPRMADSPGHDRTFNMPTRTPWPPRTVP